MYRNSRVKRNIIYNKISADRQKITIRTIRVKQTR